VQGTSVQAREFSKLFAAPEILEGKEKADYKSDVWSLGCVLYFLAAEINPWDENTRVKIQERVRLYLAEKQSLFRDSNKQY
jgi:serine/threonine protein kinase